MSLRLVCKVCKQTVCTCSLSLVNIFSPLLRLRLPSSAFFTGLDSSKYKSALDCAQQIIKHEGAGTFLKGLVPRLGRVVPGQGIIFMSFETIQNALAEALL